MKAKSTKAKPKKVKKPKKRSKGVKKSAKGSVKKSNPNSAGHHLKKHFVPHKGNSYRPHFLRLESAIIILGIIIVIELIALAQPLLTSLNKNYFLGAVLPGALVTLTNEQRAESGLGALKTNGLLAVAANLKAQDMAKKGYFSHVTPEGHSPWYWLDKAGYSYSYAGENLAVNFFESEDVAKAWMASPTHRDNIINANYKEIGIGMAQGMYEGKQTVFVVEFFGAPKFGIDESLANASSSAKIAAPGSATSTAKTTTLPTTPLTKTFATSTKVLGAEVNPPAPINITVQGQGQSQSHNASPRSAAFYLLTALSVVIFVAMLFVYFSSAKILHRDLILAGFLLIIIISILLTFNRNIFSKTVGLPSDNSGAATSSASKI